ncbi:GNAT family N-acetyltransferase [Rubricoccus marinus]|uniref:N-acetyltransferase domain-containing protein n=1 Tax=Rubricoccus marinus TaxID=716817 RepID=A0A259U090_9BACT|nr:GNAT family N-acetyltransferase [Rubricoccus marinus]OZC03422.1 hypothetical protein BSZ36_10785 [Rubricoccus marinus]
MAHFLKTLWRKVRDRLYHRVVYIYYVVDLPAPEIAQDSPRVAVDDPSAHDAPVPDGSARASPSFSNRVEDRARTGSKFYTVSFNGNLAHWGWATPFEGKIRLRSAGAVLVTGKPGVMLVDFYTEPAFRRQGLYAENIRKMLHDATASGAEQAFIATKMTNTPSRRAIEGVGFRPFREYTRTRVLGRSWTRARDLPS